MPRLRFDDALKVLSRQEFFISEERILSLIHIEMCIRDSLKGVSVGTVSNILNGRFENISDEMFRNVADRKSTRLNSSHSAKSRMPSSA